MAGLESVLKFITENSSWLIPMAAFVGGVILIVKFSDALLNFLDKLGQLLTKFFSLIMFGFTLKGFIVYLILGIIGYIIYTMFL